MNLLHVILFYVLFIVELLLRSKKVITITNSTIKKQFKGGRKFLPPLNCFFALRLATRGKLMFDVSSCL